MRPLLACLLLSGCAAFPSAGAEQACKDVFNGWLDAATHCGYEPTSTDQSVCSTAYSYDEDEVESCKAWMKTDPCGEINNDAFQAHCGKALYLRTW